MELKELSIEQGNKDGHNYIIIRLPRRLKMLASTILNGGFTESDTIFMMQVPLHYDHDDPIRHLKVMLEQLGLGDDTVCFMTAADMPKAFSIAEATQNGIGATAIVTAGISNAITAGESCREGMVPSRQIAGTINVVCLVDKPLDDCGMANAIMTMTEAKTAAMMDNNIKGTGTTSDAVLIACPNSQEGVKWAGTGSDHGIAMAKAVRKAVGESIQKWSGNKEGKSFLRLLAVRGITLDMMWSAVLGIASFDPNWSEEDIRQRFETKLRALADDINVNALIVAAVALEEKGRYGQLYGLENGRFDEDPVHLLADELLGIALAEYVGGTKALFEYIRYDKKKPGILGELGPFMDDIVASLIGSVMSNIYSEILEGEGRIS